MVRQRMEHSKMEPSSEGGMVMQRHLAKRWTAGILVAMLAGSIPLGTQAAGGLCTGKDHTLACLKRNFDKLARSDYAGFSDILRTAAQEAQSCGSTVKTANFLDLAPFIHGNAEIQEYFGEVIERLCIEQPKCFLDALIRVNAKSQRLIVEDLWDPIFMEQSAVEAVFQTNRNDPKYKSIMRLYFHR